MKLNGIHHLTNLTADLDRLIGFYQRVFDAQVTLDMEEEGLRHAFIELGPNTVLHPFEVPGVEVPQGDVPMFARGRLDHFGINTDSEDTFWELRDRVIVSFTFEDPDGARHEVIWMRPGVPADEILARPEWTTLTERPS